MLLQLPQGIFRMGIVVGEVDAGIGIAAEGVARQEEVLELYMFSYLSRVFVRDILWLNMVVLDVRLELGGRLGYVLNLFFSSICAFRTEAEEDTSADSSYNRQSTNNSSYYGTDWYRIFRYWKGGIRLR